MYILIKGYEKLRGLTGKRLQEKVREMVDRNRRKLRDYEDLLPNGGKKVMNGSGGKKGYF